MVLYRPPNQFGANSLISIRLQVKNVVFVHNNLRLADKLQELSYTEATIQWETSMAERDDDAEPDICESESSSDSDSD